MRIPVLLPLFLLPVALAASERTNVLLICVDDLKPVLDCEDPTRLFHAVPPFSLSPPVGWRKIPPRPFYPPPLST